MVWSMLDYNTSAAPGAGYGSSGSSTARSGTSGSTASGSTASGTTGTKGGTSGGLLGSYTGNSAAGSGAILSSWNAGDPNRVYELANQQGLSAQSLANLVGTDVSNVNSWLTANNRALTGANTAAARTGTNIAAGTGTNTAAGSGAVLANWALGRPDRVYDLANQQGLSAQSLANLVGTDVSNINSWLTANNKTLAGTNTAAAINSRIPTTASLLDAHNGRGEVQYTNLDANYLSSHAGSYNNGQYSDWLNSMPYINLADYTPGTQEYNDVYRYNNMHGTAAGTGNATGADADRLMLANYLMSIGVPAAQVAYVPITDELLSAAGLGTGAGVRTGAPDYNYRVSGGTTGGTTGGAGGYTGTTGGNLGDGRFISQPPGGMKVSSSTTGGMNVNSGGISSTGGSTSFDERTGTYTGAATGAGGVGATTGAGGVGSAIQAAWTSGSPMEVYRLGTQNGWTVEQVAQKVGTDPQNIYNWLSSQGLRWGNGGMAGGSNAIGSAIQNAWTSGSPMEVYKLGTQNGWTVEQVAQKVGTDPQNIYKWLSSQGLQWGPMSSQMFTQSFNTAQPGAAPNLSYDAYTTDPKALSYNATTVDPRALTYNATTVDPQALRYDPVTGQVAYATDTVEGRLAGLLNAGNPLMSLANQKALEGFASRGMLNSGDAQQAAMLAMLQAGTQIAAPDAAAYQKQALQNQADRNQALRDVYSYQGQQTLNNQNAQNDAAKNVYAYQTQQTLNNQNAQNDAAKNVYAYQTQQTLQNQQDINTARRDVYGYQTDMAKLDRTEQWKQSSMQLEGQIKQQLAMSDASLNGYLEGIKSQYAIDLQNVEQQGEFAGQAATLYDSAMRSLSNIGAQDLTTEQYNAAVTQVLAALDSALAFNSSLYGLNYSNVYGNNLTTNPGAVGAPPPPSGGTTTTRPPGVSQFDWNAYQAYLGQAPSGVADAPPPGMSFNAWMQWRSG